MLLRLETTKSRKAGDLGGSREWDYKHLKITEEQAAAISEQQQKRVAPLDLLHVLTPDEPHEIEYLPGMPIEVTLIDSNHMPGSVMFLIEGDRGAVLYMGDCRAEKRWLEA